MKLKTYWNIYKVIAIGVGTYTLLSCKPVRKVLSRVIVNQGKKLIKS